MRRRSSGGRSLRDFGVCVAGDISGFDLGSGTVWLVDWKLKVLGALSRDWAVVIMLDAKTSS